ncbi:MAG: hypothetical protein ACD_45C00717G0007 [uncultured bacterium]|nr:MAG: hypothetical protein ACD_45C00717G0007 [uncultured bacterium]
MEKETNEKNQFGEIRYNITCVQRCNITAQMIGYYVNFLCMHRVLFPFREFMQDKHFLSLAAQSFADLATDKKTQLEAREKAKQYVLDYFTQDERATKCEAYLNLYSPLLYKPSREACAQVILPRLAVYQAEKYLFSTSGMQNTVISRRIRNYKKSSRATSDQSEIKQDIPRPNTLKNSIVNLLWNNRWRAYYLKTPSEAKAEKENQEPSLALKI